MAEPLDAQQLSAALAELPGWEADGDTITRTYAFSNFREAVSFIVRIAFAAEAANHHPELWNVYSRVRVTLGHPRCRQPGDCQGYRPGARDRAHLLGIGEPGHLTGVGARVSGGEAGPDAQPAAPRITRPRLNPCTRIENTTTT